MKSEYTNSFPTKLSPLAELSNPYENQGVALERPEDALRPESSATEAVYIGGGVALLLAASVLFAGRKGNSN